MRREKYKEDSQYGSIKVTTTKKLLNVQILCFKFSSLGCFQVCHSLFPFFSSQGFNCNCLYSANVSPQITVSSFSSPPSRLSLRWGTIVFLAVGDEESNRQPQELEQRKRARSQDSISNLHCSCYLSTGPHNSILRSFKEPHISRRRACSTILPET